MPIYKNRKSGNMKIVFLGAPGSGKGTHANFVSEKYGIPKISTGDMLREEVKKGTVLGKEVEGIMESGGLVPDDKVMAILKERLKQPDCKKGFILDGFPRTVNQAKMLDGVADIEFALFFDVDREELIKRLSGRWTCKDCGEIYHEDYKKPKEEGKCDRCGGELYQREDQKIESVKKRLDLYEKETLPLLKIYEDRGVLRKVHMDDAPIEENAKKVISVVEERFAE